MAQDEVVHEGIAPPGSTGTIALALGQAHSCALRADGEVLCWGGGGSASKPPAGVLFRAIGAGGADTCGVRQDGGVVCWGYTPELAQAPAGPFVSVVVNDQGQACALRPGVEAACWGAGVYNTGRPPFLGQGAWLTLSASGDRVCGLLSNRTIECWRPSWRNSRQTYPGANYRTISLGQGQVCGLASDGALRCFDPSTGNDLPVGGIYPKGVSAGGSGTCVLELPGFVSCWGSGGIVTSAPGAEAFTTMIMGNSHACAIRPQGTVACWGANEYGQARPPLSVSGEGGVVEEGRPEDPFGRVRALASGRAHSCALLSDGSISCWDAQGSTRMAPPDGRRFVRVAAGGSNTCGVLDDGEVSCSSSNLGAVPAGPFASVAVGDNHACGLRPDGFTVCWGNEPWQPPGRFSQLAVDDQFTCGLRLDGRVECWHPSGEMRVMPEGPYRSISVRAGLVCGLQQSGDGACWSWWGTAVWSRLPGPLTMIATSNGFACGLHMDGRIECDGYAWPPYEGRYTALSGGGDHYCAIRRAGSVECWGDYHWEEITPPKALILGPAIAAGARHTCAVGEEGQVECWGNDDDGQLQSPPGTFATVGSGDRHSCALDEAGLATCWGFAGDGQLDVPPEPLANISIGRMHGCGLTPDGHARCWGWNSNGQATAPEDMSFKAIHAGFVHSCGVSPSATSPGRCWGYNGEGQLDLTGSGWLEIQAGDRHSCGLGEYYGRIDCWGSDSDGQVSQAPYGEFIALSAGGYHNCAIRNDHSIQCWGADWAGQSQAPEGRFQSVSAGSNHTCAIDGEGLRQCWGDDTHGQAPWRQLQPNQPTLALGANGPGGGLWLKRNLPEGGMGTDHSAVFRVTQGTLPPGLVLNESGQFEGPLTPGRYAITVAARGEQGLGDSRPYVLVVDGTPPLITVSPSVPAGVGGWNTSDVHVTWKVRELDTGDVWSEEGCSPVSVTTDTPGTTLTCTAQSIGGTATKSITIKRDVTAPDTQFDRTPPAATGATNAVFGFKGTDATSGIARLECSLDNAAPAACTSPATFSAGAGQHTLRVWAVDRAGNRDATPATHTWLVDVTAPSVSPQVSGTQGSNDWYVGDVRVDWSVGESESPLTTSCPSELLTTDTAAHVFTCTATSAGGSTTAHAYVKRDATAPQTALTVTPPAETGGTTALFEFAGSDAVSGVSGHECSLDGATWTTCASPISTTVAPGNHQFAVRARDAAGHVDATPATRAWTVDATAPMITPVITGPQGSNGWYIGDVRITWKVSDEDSAITAATGCREVVLASDTTGLAFTCTATSAGGTHSQTVSIKRDTTAPTIVAAATTAPNAAGWYKTAVTVAFACADATSGTAECPAAQLLGLSGAAVRSAARTISDAAGNTATSNTVAVAIDRIAPKLSPTAPATLLLNSSGSTATANASDALSGIVSQSCGTPFTGTVGGHSVRCTTTDAAGNTVSRAVGYLVVYGFQGFASPVQNPAVLNVLKAGRSVPLRWRLVDAKGTPVSSLTGAGVTVVSIACPAAAQNTITVYGGSNAGLRNLGNGYYQFDWQSASSLLGQCRRLELNLGDGQPHAAQFKFN